MSSTQASENASFEQNIASIARIKQVTIIGIIVNILLSVIKFILGIIGTSQAVVADAIHSLSDMSTDFAVLFGVKIWTAPADEHHQYGHKRIETMITAIIGFFLVIVAIGIGYNAISTIRNQDYTTPAWIALLGAIISIISKEILSRWTLIVGKREKSTAVIANAWHHRSDALSSIPVAVAVCGAVIEPNWTVLDHIGAIVVSIFILHVAWGIIKPALRELVDRGASQKDREHIKSITLATNGVNSVHAVRTRQMGYGIMVDLHIQVDGTMTVQKGHDISEKVKQNLLRDGPDVIDVLVHLEPDETNDQF